VKVMRLNASQRFFLLEGEFPRQIPDKLVVAEELEGNVLDSKDMSWSPSNLAHRQRIIRPASMSPRSDSCRRRCRYNDVHLYLAESNAQTRREWISALDKIEALKPRAVVASHKRPRRPTVQDH